MSTAQLNRLASDWQPLAPLVAVPRTEADYERLSAMLDELADEVGENESHPLAGLMDVIGTLVEAYENEHVAELTGLTFCPWRGTVGRGTTLRVAWNFRATEKIPNMNTP